MNKELKFRVWDLEEKRFWNTKNGYYFWKDNMYLEMGLSGFLKRVNEFVVQQFTGLKDKNGRDIFEGDILKMFVPYPETDYNELYFCEFKVNAGTSSFVLTNKNKKWHHGGKSEMLEIIGNIYENPELLK